MVKQNLMVFSACAQFFKVYGGSRIFKDTLRYYCLIQASEIEKTFSHCVLPSVRQNLDEWVQSIALYNIMRQKEETLKIKISPLNRD